MRAQLLCVVFLSPIQYSLFVCAIQMSKLNSIPSQLFNVKSQQKNYDRIMVHINHCCGKWQFIKHDLCADASSQNTWTCCLLNKRSKLHGSLVGNLILAQIIICHLAYWLGYKLYIIFTKKISNFFFSIEDAWGDRYRDNRYKDRSDIQPLDLVSSVSHT